MALNYLSYPTPVVNLPQRTSRQTAMSHRIRYYQDNCIFSACALLEKQTITSSVIPWFALSDLQVRITHIVIPTFWEYLLAIYVCNLGIGRLKKFRLPGLFIFSNQQTFHKLIYRSYNKLHCAYYLNLTLSNNVYLFFIFFNSGSMYHGWMNVISFSI